MQKSLFAPIVKWISQSSSERLVVGLSSSHQKITNFALVTQLDRVLGFEPRSCGFESCREHQKAFIYGYSSDFDNC